MAKNFAAIYASENDSSSLNQEIYLKVETTRGQIIAPTSSDFLYTLAGSTIEFTQPIESSPQRSGRHHTDEIKSKKELSWTLPALFNIDTSLGAASSAEIDTPVRALYKSLLGYEDTSAGAVYDARNDPSTSFSLFEIADKWSKQCRGCFVDGATLTFPGDGRAQQEFRGMGKDAFLIGIGKSTVNNNAVNTVTLQAGEGKRFRVGGLVMIIESDGTTRSADTPDGSPRTVTAVNGDIATLSGAVLADANGSVTPVYLCYYQPATKTAISNPITGLVGSFSVVGLDSQCLRNGTITIENAHEAINYCYGHDALDDRLFVAANRMTATLSIEMNLNEDTLGLYNSIADFTGQDVTIVLGAASGRRLEVAMPNVKFSLPSISVPETGSIPVTYEGTCYQTDLDQYDEITVSFI